MTLHPDRSEVLAGLDRSLRDLRDTGYLWLTNLPVAETTDLTRFQAVYADVQVKAAYDSTTNTPQTTLRGIWVLWPPTGPAA